MKNEVIILSESASFSHSRYIGPYAVAKKLRDNGIDTVVFDFFRRPYCDFWSIFESLITKDTKFLCFSNTFLFDKKSIAKESSVQIKAVKLDNFIDKLIDPAISEEDEKETLTDYVDSQMNLCWEGPEHVDQFFSKIKKLCPGIKIIMGGSRTTEMYQFAKLVDVSKYRLKDWVDIWFLGYGDDALCDIIQNWGKYPLDDINGFKFLNQSKYPHWPKYQMPLNPFTEKDAISEHEMLPLETSRGCAFNCKFCHYEKGYSKKMCKDGMRKQLEYYYDNFGITKYHLTSDCFNDNYEHVKDFHEVVTQLSFKTEYASYARADLCNRYPEVSDLMAESGFKLAQVGIESLTHEVAKASGRGLSPEKIIDILTYWKKLGMDMTANFIVGLPGETPETQREQFKWASEQNIVTPKFRALRVYPYFDDIKNVMGYPHYSLDPKKYGFEEFSFNPFMWWKHKTMDLRQARALDKEWNKDWFPKLPKEFQKSDQSFRDDIAFVDNNWYNKNKSILDYYKRLVDKNG